MKVKKQQNYEEGIKVIGEDCTIITLAVNQQGCAGTVSITFNLFICI